MFVFNGISSQDMKVTCKEETFITRASRVYEEMSIEGKSDISITELNYGSVENKLELFLHDVNLEDDVLSWLSGEGTLIYKGRKTTIYFVDEISIEDLFGKKRILKTSYIRKPFWYPENDEYIIVKNTIINNGSVESRPMIKLVGTGKADISIAGVRFIYNFDEDGEVEIDCLEKTETYNGLSKSKNIEIGFIYPILKKGNNIVIIHSGTVEIYVKRKDVFL